MPVQAVSGRLRAKYDSENSTHTIEANNNVLIVDILLTICSGLLARRAAKMMRKMQLPRVVFTTISRRQTQTNPSASQKVISAMSLRQTVLSAPAET